MHNFFEQVRKSVQARVDCMQELQILKQNTQDFCQIFKSGAKPCVIAEIKFASPSKGRIYQGDLSHTGIAEDYLNHGAAALSVLAEPDFFKGDVQYIGEIRSCFPEAHILLKDFILSEKQIVQGLHYGANAVLLIVAFLSREQLKKLYGFAMELGLTPIVEIHDEEDLEIALALNPKIIGINNRNLKTLEINLETSRRLIQKIPHEVLTICESGIKTHAHIQEMKALGFHGFLVGSHLMTHASPGLALRALLN